MLRFLAWTMMLCLAGLTWGAASGASVKKHAKKSSSKTGARKSGGTKSTGKAAKSSPSTATAKRTTWRNRQLAPTPARYREIQQALAAKGYLNAENATGVWNQSSVDALRRFQADQNIASTGKINSLSLIALGLGPKREPAAAKAPVPPPPPAP